MRPTLSRSPNAPHRVFELRHASCTTANYRSSARVGNRNGLPDLTAGTGNDRDLPCRGRLFVILLFHQYGFVDRTLFALTVVRESYRDIQIEARKWERSLVGECHRRTCVKAAI
jgi:hypothetical protein